VRMQWGRAAEGGAARRRNETHKGSVSVKLTAHRWPRSFSATQEYEDRRAMAERHGLGSKPSRPRITAAAREHFALDEDGRWRLRQRIVG